jgi:hypothetical protein
MARCHGGGHVRGRVRGLRATGPASSRRPTRLPSTRSCSLWAGVRKNSLAKARPAFFPEAAYVQVKAIGDPRGDYTGRLLADYRLDLAAAHALLGAHPGSAELVGVKLPQSSVHWVPPRICENRVGYYEWPNARLVYRQNGTVRSFGIASMISWRGVWYVVHPGPLCAPRRSAWSTIRAPGTGFRALRRPAEIRSVRPRTNDPSGLNKDPGAFCRCVIHER